MSDYSWNKCERKTRYTSLQKAKNVIKAKKKKVYISHNLGIYHCDLCDGYHIGHSRYKE